MEYLDHFENYRTNLVTIIGYLIGIKEDVLYDEKLQFNLETLKEISNDVKCNIIRHLSIIRMDYIRNFKQISNGQFNLQPLETMTDYISMDSVKYLRDKSIEVIKVNYKPAYLIAFVNQYILENIDKIKSYIPSWIKWEYVRNLFLMPGGNAGNNGNSLQGSSGQKVVNAINKVRKIIGTNTVFYPYGTYVNWPENKMESHYGNILFTDEKFLKLLYASHGDTFKANDYVIDATDETKDYVYDFVSEAKNVCVFVDCENVDPYKFASVFMNLEEEKFNKIKKIILFDDVNTSTAWDYLTSLLNLPIEHHEIERVLENKSLVDIVMTATACKEYYQNNTESIILASSDSDFWGLISSLPYARFLVLNESYKTSDVILSKLEEHEINYCFMDSFAQDEVQEFKERVLYKNLQNIIDEFNEERVFNFEGADDLLERIFYEAGVNGSYSQLEQEKQAFYNDYLKYGFVIQPVEENGKIIYKMTINKK